MCILSGDLGDVDAHYNLSVMHSEDEGVEKATIGGNPAARYELGKHEGRSERIDKMVKHWIIAARLGHDESLDAMKKSFVKGFASKEDYASALRGHQAAVDATKSAQRNAAEEYLIQVRT